mgnify:CR=1 FL=1
MQDATVKIRNLCKWCLQERRRGPVIEELTDDVEGAGKAEDQPIVEHPDDEGVIGIGH